VCAQGLSAGGVYSGVYNIPHYVRHPELITEHLTITQAGAEVHSTLEPAHIVLGIKETPLDSLVTSPVRSVSQNALVPRTHMMFSHTAKGQEYNMPLLSRFLAGGDRFADPKLSGDNPLPQLAARLVDYELLTGPDDKRTVAFGWHAGGM
jgi:alpha-aminoadipic semialdehyde synthase